mmetsp:Transcript_113796/g.322269  ORF Transcript_113796/g.322269 Transcript_113796/m.322269 type:complete len:316 (-) Transcript_113796:739-1686(-)
MQYTVAVAEQAVVDEVRQHAADGGEVLVVLVDTLRRTRHDEFTVPADMFPAVAEGTLLPAGRRSVGLLSAVVQVREAVHEILPHLPPLPHRLERHPVDHVVVCVHAQELLAEVARLPPSAQVAVRDARGAENDGRVRLSRPALNLGLGSREHCQGAAEAVAREHEVPVVRDSVEEAEDVAVRPLPHLRQYALHSVDKTLVHEARGVLALPVLAELQAHADDVGVDLPVLHGRELGPAEDDDGQLRAWRLEEAGVDVLPVLDEHVHVPVVDPWARVDVLRPHAVRQGRPHLRLVDLRAAEPHAFRQPAPDEAGDSR